MKNPKNASKKNPAASIKIRDLKPSKGGNVKGGACVKGEHLKSP